MNWKILLVTGVLSIGLGALLWAVIGMVLLVGYSYRYEVNQVADRVIAELMPGHVISHGRTAEVARTGSGDFAISAQINGARVHMVVDTGATSVVLTAEDAKAAGLPLALLNYTVSIETANGRARAAPVTLDRIAMGELEERSVEALVVQPGQLRTSLLDAARDRIASPVERLLLICFHYDPKSGKYSATVDTIARGVGAITALALGVLIMRLRRKERKATA